MKRLLIGIVVVFVVVTGVILFYLASVWNPTLPAQLIGRVHARAAAHGGYTPLRDIPVFLQRAIIATEDRQFYHNEGIDLEGIARAMVVDAIHLRPVQGASTITEQLVKDMFLSDQKTLERKLRQIALALLISHALSKNEILSLYLNEVYLGQGAYGVGQAAHVYFDRNADQLTPAQCALLAGLPQAPSAYDPLANLSLAKARQKEVLDGMVSAGDLSASAAAAVYNAPLFLSPGP